MAVWGLVRWVHFQGLLRPFGARAIAAQWGEPTSENGGSFSPTLSFGCGSSPESATKEKEECKSNDSGTTSPLRGSCHCFAMGRTKSSPPTKVARKKRCKSNVSGTTSSLRSSCHCFAMGRTDIRERRLVLPCFLVRMWFSSDQSTKKNEMQKSISFFLVHFQGLEPWAH